MSAAVIMSGASNGQPYSKSYDWSQLFGFSGTLDMCAFDTPISKSFDVRWETSRWSKHS